MIVVDYTKNYDKKVLQDILILIKEVAEELGKELTYGTRDSDVAINETRLDYKETEGINNTASLFNNTLYITVDYFWGASHKGYLTFYKDNLIDILKYKIGEIE